MYFGRKPNRIRNKLFLGGKKEFEVLEENKSSFETGESKREELMDLEIERDAIRQKALDTFNEGGCTVYGKAGVKAKLPRRNCFDSHSHFQKK